MMGLTNLTTLASSSLLVEDVGLLLHVHEGVVAVAAGQDLLERVRAHAIKLLDPVEDARARGHPPFDRQVNALAGRLFGQKIKRIIRRDYKAIRGRRLVGRRFARRRRFSGLVLGWRGGHLPERERQKPMAQGELRPAGVADPPRVSRFQLLFVRQAERRRHVREELLLVDEFRIDHVVDDRPALARCVVDDFLAKFLVLDPRRLRGLEKERLHLGPAPGGGRRGKHRHGTEKSRRGRIAPCHTTPLRQPTSAGVQITTSWLGWPQPSGSVLAAGLSRRTLADVGPARRRARLGPAAPRSVCG